MAPATPPGRSALAIVRIDGPDSNSILTSITKSALPPIRHAAFVHLYNDTDALDECIAIRYEAPHSFTGNDLVELTLHGNPLIVERVIARCVELSARMAEPGEFSERAVLNGKIDLVQAESIADLINARTALQAKLSLSNLDGVLSRKAAAVRQTLLEVIARLEAALDFSEEGYEFITHDEARTRVANALVELESMSDTYRRGRATTAGLSLVILGRPNAGKSTLLNRLVGSDRAIVTPIPGTTRDIVRETIEIGGLPVTIADTAGLRHSDDVVEGIGIERARQAAATADLILYLVDSSSGITAEDASELARYPDALVIHTKADLVTLPSALSISAVSDQGMPELLGTLDQLVRDQFAAPEGALVNERQRLAVDEAASGLRAALDTLQLGLDEQMVIVDLYRSANALGTLTGAITRDNILDEIFSNFCIGK
ncbi:MAG: tRNA uridine-5-carboxymethylaminomethyl(34) synthesis GTPase MnmE [Thermoanaerobaculia bacterium]